MKPILSNKVLNYEAFVNEKVSKKDLMKASGTIATVTGILGQFGYDKEWLKDQSNGISFSRMRALPSIEMFHRVHLC